MRLIALATLLALAGCDADQIKPINTNTLRVELYSGGKKIGNWLTTEEIARRGSTYYFRDSGTGEVVVITGQVKISVALEAD